MKNFAVCSISIFALSGASGCTKASTDHNAQEARLPSASLAGAAAPTGNPSTTVVDVSKQAMSVDRFERLVLGLASCSLERYQIDPNCPGMQALNAAIHQSKAWTDRATVNAEVGQRQITHTSPAIRVKAGELLAGTPAGFEAIATAAAVETNTNVLQAFVRIAANQGQNAKVAAMLLAAADHADRDVRTQAVYALAAPANRGVVGAAEKLAAIAGHDTDKDVRQTACEYGGRLGNDAMLPVYEAATANANDKDLYSACMEGLVAMFHNHPAFDTASEAAYKLFLRRLEAKPRTEQSPPWNVMSTFCYFSHESDLDKLADWKKRATWFNPTDVRHAMTSVVIDKHASWMARAAAVESLVGLGATKSELAALKTGLGPADKQVLDKIAQAIAE